MRSNSANDCQYDAERDDAILSVILGYYFNQT